MSAPDRLPNTIRELKRIMSAIHNRDGDGAASACREHVKSAAAVAIAILRERELFEEEEADEGVGSAPRASRSKVALPSI
jgi:hypothetical protein